MDHVMCNQKIEFDEMPIGQCFANMFHQLDCNSKNLYYEIDYLTQIIDLESRWDNNYCYVNIYFLQNYHDCINNQFLAGKCENSTNPTCQDDLIKIEVPMVLYVSRILANLPLKIGQCKVTEGNCVCDQSIEDHGQCKFFFI